MPKPAVRIGFLALLVTVIVVLYLVPGPREDIAAIQWSLKLSATTADVVEGVRAVARSQPLDQPVQPEILAAGLAAMPLKARFGSADPVAISVEDHAICYLMPHSGVARIPAEFSRGDGHVALRMELSQFELWRELATGEVTLLPDGNGAKND